MINEAIINVLVVDDEVIPNSLVQLQLERLGYKVIGNAYDGCEAVRLTEELHPDVIVMDLRMMDPTTGREDRMAGLKAADAIQHCCPTPVVVVTAYESSELVKQASLIGVGAYLVKPTKEKDLERAITIALARFRDFMELRRLHTELELYNAEIDAFSSAVAQGLKKPIKQITERAQALLQTPNSPSHEQTLEEIRSITRESYGILNISKELLLLARLRRVDNVEMRSFNMEHTVRNACQRLQGLVESRAIQFTLPAVWPAAKGIESWVEEVWFGLLSNAIHYGLSPHPPFTVDIGAELEGDDRVCCWVRDYGPGIPSAEQQALFSPPGARQPVAGKGIKLYLVRQLVERMGGKVNSVSPVFRNEAEHPCGSLFSFTLPAVTHAGHPDLSTPEQFPTTL